MLAEVVKLVRDFRSRIKICIQQTSDAVGRIKPDLPDILTGREVCIVNLLLARRISRCLRIFRSAVCIGPDDIPINGTLRPELIIAIKVCIRYSSLFIRLRLRCGGCYRVWGSRRCGTIDRRYSI